MSVESSEWVGIVEAKRYRKILEFDLVLTSVGIESKVERIGRDWVLLVPNNLERSARDQISLYLSENRIFNRSRAPSPIIDSGIVGCVVFVALIWSIWILEGLGVIPNFRNQGAMWVHAVENGEWWRCITALLLHANIAHIVGNTVMGVVFGCLVARHFGSGLCWLLVLLCGAMGNYLNSLIQGSMFASIGASTATFAAVGLLAGLFFRRRLIIGRGWRYNALPIAGAIGLFILLGIGGENTDVIAHLTGMFCGVVVGAVVASFNLRWLGRSGQWIAGAVAIGVICWAVLKTNPW